MRAASQFLQLVSLALRENRDEAAFIAVIQIVMTLGFVVGFGYFFDDISERHALYLTTGTATNVLVTSAIVGLPQVISQAKAHGRLDYMLALPIGRDLYLASLVAYLAVTTLPAMILAVLFGIWYYDLPLVLDPLLVVVVPLVVLSLAGVGVALGLLSPNPNFTNAVSNATIFYVLLFAPILIPAEQLPGVLREVSTFLPTTYAADAMRGALTDLAGTHLMRSTLVLAGFAAVSLGLSAASVRRRA